MKALLNQVLDGEDLSSDQASSVLDAMVDPDVSAVVKAAMLAGLRAKGETGEELRGMAMAMRAKARTVAVPDHLDVVDTCGTGGDGSDSFNVSTATALLLGAAGVPVVKHGNRSVSSRSGSADMIEALGVPMARTPDEARRQLVDTNFAFLFAPDFHEATAAVVPVRRALGVRTAFNLLGPLANPAEPKHQLIGAYSEEACRVMADALSGMPITRCFVVHGTPGWDEATPCGPFVRFDVRPGHVERMEFDPRFSYGIAACEPSELAGGDAEYNARLLFQVFSGARGALRDAVTLNAALVLELTGRAASPKDGVALAQDVIDSGRATWFLERLTP